MADGQGFGIIQNVVSTLKDIQKTLTSIYTVLGNSYIALSGNNVFTGNNTFQGTSLFSGAATFSVGTVFNGLVSILAGMKYGVRVVTAAGAVTVSATDVVVVVNKTVGAATTVNLPAGVLGTYFIIKDGKGDGSTHNITMMPAAGTIDGAATLVISTNYGVARLVYNGSEWSVI